MTPNNKLKALIFLFLSLIVVTSPIAEAQIGNLVGGVGSVVGGAVDGVFGGLPNLIHINGSISCSLGGSTGAGNGVDIPPFPDALVQLRCGGKVVESARTNTNGVFNILLDLLPNLVQTLLSSCNIVVMYPLSTCNANLPSFGGLLSDGLNILPVVGNALNQTVNFIPGVLRYLPTITINHSGISLRPIDPLHIPIISIN